MKFSADKPCRFIYRTTGPVRVRKTLEARSYQPHVTMFSMCRQVQDLEKLISLDGTGRVSCQQSGMESYDVLSAFSMSYSTGNPRPPPPMANPLFQPPFGGQRKKWRRYTVKKPEFPDAEGKHLPSTALLEQDATQPPKRMDEEMRPGYQPQEQRHQRR